MNIFFLHPDPRRCARWHCDKHVVKMILESCQLLYTAHWVLALPARPPYIDIAPNGGYKPTHRNHPCAVWVRASVDNYRWLVRLTQCLLDEYRFRYGDHKIHKCQDHLDWLQLVEPDLPRVGFTPPPQAMPDEYRRSNPVVAYRLFYALDKDARRGIVSYTKRHRPHFLK